MDRLRRVLRFSDRAHEIPYPMQSTPRFEAPSSFSPDSPEEFVRCLRSGGIRVSEGRHTIYVPPQAEIDRMFGAMVACYPSNSGFKILRRFARPQEARNVSTADRRGLLKLTGGIQEQAFSAACLSIYDFGPRLLDVAHLRIGKLDATVMVVEHVPGRSPTFTEHTEFIHRLKQLKTDGLFSYSDAQIPPAAEYLYRDPEYSLDVCVS